MFFRVMLFGWQFLLDLIAVLRMTDDEKDLEIMLLRQQLRIVERKQARGPQIPRWQKVPLAALTVRMKDKTNNAREALAESVRLFKPDTLIGWHRAIVRCKWTYKQDRKPGRIEIVNIPYQAPNANAFAERWVRSVREECLDRLIILNERHLRRVMTKYVAYFNARRPHQGLVQNSPLGLAPVSTQGTIRRREVLGGIISDYYREAA